MREEDHLEKTRAAPEDDSSLNGNFTVRMNKGVEYVMWSGKK